MTAKDLGASSGTFHRYASTMVRSRWDYFSGDHTLDLMLNDRYFRTVLGMVDVGDRIQIVDRNGDEAEVRVDFLDDERMLVGISLVERLVMRPVSGKPAIRMVGGRGRGARYQIVDADGKVLEPSIAGKKNAERQLDTYLEKELA